MASGQPGPRGDSSPSTQPDRFVNKYSTNVAKHFKEEKLRTAGTPAGGVEYLTARDTSTCEHWTVYAEGSGSWNVEASPNPSSNIWQQLSASDKSGDGYFTTSEYHPWIRVAVRAGADLEVWLCKKYATY